ncbi:hypothetical protein AGABI1DRAFT_42719 [Agaricus bisporus var. burnettii JB137-S8]|uniref:Uncharacterized protein n=1 Tax=Agaricus bisporus var. burnettii (strain JB137-S8 / ATCC MYA-4627 / FGSC 10392) TaxID=597362 RepID=K5VTB9_AGABU|nr:uncharacterized protein AGABI1DRAFT_42719 [Agaricus bisporus var. burnettii JB137-S8]EKM77699.1 hypothetical protein AGABI1DRAFT_42719 [Agaricus bisporus var. burnettii JB137-S8]
MTLGHPAGTNVLENNRTLSLGLRSLKPPDSVSPSNARSEKSSKPEHERQDGLSDAEWEIRTGRILLVLQETLPEIFKMGLVTSVDKSTGAPIKPSSVLPLTLGPSANPLDFLHLSSQGQHREGGGIEPIYSPKVTLEYTPPVALPAPFPRTLHIEGVPLYVASASFLRHTMNALYTDLVVTLVKVSLDVPPSPKRKEAFSNGEEPASNPPERKRFQREKSLHLRLITTGKARVSGSPTEWEVDCTYIFSPVSGLVHKHIINSIHPAPHQAVYDSFSKLVGFGWRSSEEAEKGPAPGTMCKGHSK